ncbi:MAG: PilX N-terminal domain-containing pilus assembly protein [Pseudomonadota bacterium]|nr:PilX N-terminal domain-containing pilus assembly protein [Pseudomonadota bacterium]
MPTMNPSRGLVRRPFRGKVAARGIALLIALILLIVIGISSVAAMRTALFGELISQNLRAQNLAFQAAETALRYCEDEVANNPAVVTFWLNDATILSEWTDMDNWDTANGRVTPIPATILGGATAVQYPIGPECIIRRLSFDEVYSAATLAPGAALPEDRGMSSEYLFFFRVTARGFSPDFERDDDGVPISGAEVWVQSTMRGVL